MFTEAQRATLIAIARHAIEQAVAGTVVEAPPLADAPPASGAFVTIKRDSELRGCIGTLECRRPLADEVAHVAVSAAREDPRFAPLRPAELNDISIEVSILGPLEPVDPADPAAIIVGRHGLVVEHGRRRGLLLPQVASEWGWNRDEFLAHTCRKAGLPPDAWRHGATVYRFEAEVFGETRGGSHSTRVE